MWKPGEVQLKHGTNVKDELLLRSILVDDSQRSWKHICQLKNGVIQFILDNAGLETVTDLFFCDVLLRFGVAKTIILHTKRSPFFVSDSMVKDVMKTIQHLQSDSNSNVQAISSRLTQALQKGSLVLQNDW